MVFRDCGFVGRGVRMGCVLVGNVICVYSKYDMAIFLPATKSKQPNKERTIALTNMA